jgi:methionyl aminopeptidase
MIPIKDHVSISKMQTTGQLLAEVFDAISDFIKAQISTLELDSLIERELKIRNLISGSKGYRGFRHASCISLNDEVVHGIPSPCRIIKSGDLVKVDICASYKGFFADMARTYFVDGDDRDVKEFVSVAQRSLDKGIEQAVAGKRLSDISAAVQGEVEKHGFGVVRDFAGHGIGTSMHEDPEILNYGVKGKGPVLKCGMALAIEPMITMKNYHVFIAKDGWTVKTVDGSLAAHVEDTVIVTDNGPEIITRKK